LYGLRQARKQIVFMAVDQRHYRKRTLDIVVGQRAERRECKEIEEKR